MRVHIQDVLARIAQVSGGYAGMDMSAAIEEYWQHYPYRLLVSITGDVEATELDYLDRHGPSDTLYFSLHDYAQGRKLAEDLFRTVPGNMPDTDDESSFHADDKLFLFVYIQKEGPGK